MFNKLKKSLKVCKDLDTLEFNFDANRKSCENNPYTIEHPNGKYSIWTSNGFWFTALWEIDGMPVSTNNAVCKFGAVGKVLVWWKCQEHIRKWQAAHYMVQESKNRRLLDVIMED